MIAFNQYTGFSPKLVFLAVLAAFNPAHAAEGDITNPPGAPQVSVSAGLGISATGDARTLFGQYNGLRRNDEHLLLDIDALYRDDATGILTTFKGRNLGLDSRDLRFSQKKQGDWKYFVEYGELTRHDPRTISTGVQGIGTNTLTVDGNAAKRDVNLQTARKSATLGLEKWFTPFLQFEANFKSENKDGARIFGRGNWGPSAMLLLPEPIDSNIKQIDAKLNFSGDKFLLSGAYYGSFYTNANGSLHTPSSNFYSPTGASGAAIPPAFDVPMALPPDNQAHQFSLAGNYAITPATRATFKYAKTLATQRESFASMGLTPPAGVNDLHGDMETTLTQFGLTARPMAKLSVLADLRYENRADKTPIALYGQGATTNSPDPLKKLNGKLEASYRLPDNYRVTLGIDYDKVNRGIFPSTYKPGGTNLWREETNDLGWRAELRRSMSETLNAGISYTRSRSAGSGWRDCTAAPCGSIISDAAAAALNSGAPQAAYTIMDIRREKLKLSADWSPAEKLSLQFMVEGGKDEYTVPHTEAISRGLQDTGMRLYSVDAALALSDMWKLTSYLSQGEHTSHVNYSYVAELASTNTALGIGVRGKPTGKFEVGGDLSYMNDKSRYSLTQATNGSLPTVTFRQTTLRFFGKKSLEKNADVRVDLVHQSTYLNEWSWENNGSSFSYSDLTTVSMQKNQKAAYMGATYTYKFK